MENPCLKSETNLGQSERNIAMDNMLLKSEYVVLQQEWCNQQEIIGRLKSEVTKLRSKLNNQAQFCSKLGSQYGYIVWNATKIPNMTNKILRENKILELSEIMIEVLISFLNTYRAHTPISKMDETRFVLSTVGLVANLTTVEEGRRFFSRSDNGKSVMRFITDLVTRIPSPSGNQLKKVSYAALHNVMIDSTGPSKPICIDLVRQLNDDLKSMNTIIVEPGLRLLALKLLHSLVRSIRSKSGYNAIKCNVELSRLIELASAIDSETQAEARNVLDDIRKTDEYYGYKVPTS